MSDEGVGEKIVEAGIELVNPGGRPDVLRDAAKAWGDMASSLDKMVLNLDKQIKAARENGWKGPSADAFQQRWNEVKKSINDSDEVFQEAKKNLNKAADNIEEINEQIHQIYLEIGISVGVSVGLSFITMGFSAAAGAANATRLAAQAGRAAQALGRILSTISNAFRALQGASGPLRIGVKLGAEYAVNTGSGMVTSALSGKGLEASENAVNGAWGMIGGAGAGKAFSRMEPGLLRNAAEGAAGGALGSLGGDTSNNLLHNKEFDASQMLIGAVGGAAGGASGGVATGEIAEGSARQAGRSNEGGDFDFGADLVANQPSGINAGLQGNQSKDVDALLNGSPREDEDPAEPGARKEHQEMAKKLREDSKDTSLSEDFG